MWGGPWPSARIPRRAQSSWRAPTKEREVAPLNSIHIPMTLTTNLLEDVHLEGVDVAAVRHAVDPHEDVVPVVLAAIQTDYE